ncbi:MAG TPA: undecaprenyl-diphosphate phosphatase [Longimicrobiales bacterium]|nr:undecaprenyl-diphosphate phosphatase [Longimicrobiales bacterium]
MTYFDAIVLGLVQGLTEFLPVSSSGHLVMAQTFLGIPSPGVFLEVALHVATLLSVIVVYRGKLAELVMGSLRRDTRALRYVGLLILATLPVVALGLLFREPIEAAFDTPYVTGFMLVVTGFILWSTTLGRSERTHDQPTAVHALAMGFAQCLALLPGISRSGSTIAAGLWTGLRGERAAEFSFLMSLPAIAGAAVLQAAELGGDIAVSGPLAAGFLAALLSGIAAIKSLIWLVRRQGFHKFAWYVWPVGLAFLAYLYLS